MASMDITDAEKVLGLYRPYDESDVSRAYRAAVKKNHPDLGGSPETMTEINAAKSTIEKFLRSGGDASTPAPAHQPKPHRSPRAKDNEQEDAQRTSEASEREATSSIEDAIDEAAQTMASEKKDEPASDDERSAREVAQDNKATKARAKARRKNSKPMRQAPAWLYMTLRAVVFAVFVLLAADVVNSPLENLGDGLDKIIAIGVWLGGGILLNGVIARLILRLFRMEV